VAKLNDLRDHSWVVICARIRNREHPREDDLAAALRRGEVVPPEAQAYLANLLEGRIDRRGQLETREGSGRKPSLCCYKCRWTSLYTATPWT
jgi:hypothetical protein